MAGNRTRWLTVAFSLAVALVLAACGSGGSGATGNQSNTGVQDLQLGQTGQLHYSVHNVTGTFTLSLTISHLNTDPTVLNPISPSSGPIPPAAGTHWVTMDLVMRTNGAPGYQGSINDVVLQGSDGHHYADHPEVTVTGESPQTAFYRVPPKTTVTNVLIFQLPTGVSARQLRFSDSSTIAAHSSGFVTWNLGS